jgi:hypothetical protein
VPEDEESRINMAVRRIRRERKLSDSIGDGLKKSSPKAAFGDFVAAGNPLPPGQIFETVEVTRPAPGSLHELNR